MNIIRLPHEVNSYSENSPFVTLSHPSLKKLIVDDPNQKYEWQGRFFIRCPSEDGKLDMSSFDKWPAALEHIKNNPNDQYGFGFQEII
jgi:hypothetical protein